MDTASLVLFASALLLASGTPGPGIATLVARVLGSGLGGGIPIALGLAVGDVIWLTAGVWGLAALARSYEAVFTVVKWVGIAYLVFLAWKMWTAQVAARDVAAIARREPPMALFLAGLSVCLGNPKVMAFYWALVPTLIDLRTITVPGWLQLCLATFGVLTITFGGYMLLADKARALFKEAEAVRTLNRGAAVAIAGTALWMAWR
jgi:threonine/homoserine/homoserine lactone efflux protein